MRRHKSHKNFATQESGIKPKKESSLSNFVTLPLKHKIGSVPEFLPPMSRQGKLSVKRLPKVVKKITEKMVKSEGGKVQLLSAFEGPYAFPKYNQMLREK